MDRIIALAIQVKGTKEETALLVKLQGSVDGVKKELVRLRKEERDGVITAEQASKARANLNVQYKANSNALQDLQAKILQNNDALRKNSGFVAGVRKGIQEAIPSFTQLAGAMGLAFGVTEIVQFGKEAVKLALKAEGIERAFAKLNRAGFLDELRKATKGTVSDLELMQRAVQADKLGLPIEQMATFLGFAAQRARETGESVEFLVDSIVKGIGRQSTLIIDNLGISSKRVSEEFKRTGDFAKAVSVIIQEEMELSGEAVETNADKVGRLNAMWENFKKTIGEDIVAGANSIVELLFGEKSEDEKKAEDKAKKRSAMLVELRKLDEESLKKRTKLNQDLIIIADKEAAKEEERINKRLASGKELLLSEKETHTNILRRIADDKEFYDTEIKLIQKVISEKEAAARKARENGEETKSTAKAVNKELGKMPVELTPLIVKLNEELRKTPEILTQIEEVSVIAGKSIQDQIAEFIDSSKFQEFQNDIFSIRDNINQIQQNKTDERIKNLEKESDAQIKSIDAQIEAQNKLGNNTDLLEKQKQKLIETTNKKIEQEQRKQFEKDKRLAKARAAILGIEAIIKTYSTYGYPLGVAFALAQAAVTATQIAEIESRTFAEGGIVPKEGGIIKGRSHKQGGVKFMAGGVLNEAQGGEPILVKEAGDNPVTRSVLSAINVAHGGRAFAEGGIVPAHKFKLGGITPSFTTRAAAVAGTNSSQMMSMISDLIDNKISNIKVTNVASETAATNTKISNIQSEVNIRG